MNPKPKSVPLFTQVDISSGPTTTPVSHAGVGGVQSTHLLRDILAALDRQNELIEELVQTVSSHQRQRDEELKKWRHNNRRLSVKCRQAAETLSRVHVEFLDNVTREVIDSADDLSDGEFLLNEFVDRHGPRMAHLTGMLHMLGQLAAPEPQADAPAGS